MLLRLSTEIEDHRQNSEPGLVFVVRSRHDRLWNTLALRVCACPAFAVPDFADDDAAALYVAALNFRTMLDAALLARGGSRFVGDALSLFDSGAQEFRA